MSARIQRKDLERLVRLSERVKRDDERPVWDIDGLVHDKQLEFIRDPSRFKVACCGRRSGKTFGIVLAMLDVAVRNPGITILYLAVTRIQAKGLIWDDLLAFLHDFEVPIDKCDANDLVIRLGNRSRIIVAGADNERIMERFRGYGFQLAVIDEAQSFQPHIRELVGRVMMPALLANRGSMILAGTPGPVSRGFFYEKCHGLLPNGQPDPKAFKRFHWNGFDNPLMPAVVSGEATPAELMEEAKAMCPDPSEYKREYLGEWDDDINKRVFQWEEDVNGFDDDELPDDLECVFGMDTGHKDRDAIVVLGWSPTDPERRLWLLDEYLREEKDQGWVHFCGRVRDLAAKYHPRAVVIDPASGGAKTAVDLKTHYGIRNAVGAEKLKKTDFVSFVNEDIRSGRFRIKGTSAAAHESFLIFWRDHRDKERSKRTPDGGHHSDVWDAILYAWRECKHFRDPRERTRAKERDPWRWTEEEHIQFLDQQRGDPETPWWARGTPT